MRKQRTVKELKVNRISVAVMAAGLRHGVSPDLTEEELFKQSREIVTTKLKLKATATIDKWVEACSMATVETKNSRGLARLSGVPLDVLDPDNRDLDMPETNGSSTE